MGRFETVLKTDVGRMRERNEDCSLVMHWELEGEQTGGPVVLVAVADGMGGHANGNIASKMALRALSAALVQGLSRSPLEGLAAMADDHVVNMLNEAVTAAAQQVNQAAQHGLVDMGTTLCAALLVGTRAFIANVGDSRAYLIDGEIQQISKDHSLVAQLVEKGELTAEEALAHPKRNEIYRMLGFGRPANPDFFTLELQPDDVLILCTDGLTNTVGEPELQEAFAGLPALDATARHLIDLANSRGGPDNITVVAVRVLPMPGGGGEDR